MNDEIEKMIRLIAEARHIANGMHEFAYRVSPTSNITKSLDDIVNGLQKAIEDSLSLQSSLKK